MSLLTKEAILNSTDRATKIVEVPAWGGSVTLQEMTGRQRDRFESIVLNEKVRRTIPDLKAWLVAQSIVDEQGNLMFTESEVGKLAEKSALALFDIVKHIRELNGLEASAVETAEKNSESAPNEDNGSD